MVNLLGLFYQKKRPYMFFSKLVTLQVRYDVFQKKIEAMFLFFVD